MLPDTLHQLPQPERFAYAKLLAHVTRIDDELSIDEMAVFEQRLGTALGAGVSAGVGALFPCDERIKVDMAPLESTEVNDSLAEIAFFVKGLRECA